MASNNRKDLISEKHQSFWQLACITGSALGLPASVIGGKMAKMYGAGTSLIAVIVGNLILWLIGLGIISMTKTREHAIENIGNYLGNKISIIAALVWIFAFVIWYAIQVEGISQIIQIAFNVRDNWVIAGLLGLVVALVSTGGIRWIKWICSIAFPLLILYLIYALVRLGVLANFSNSWGFSIFPVLPVIVVWLPGIVSLPTFFRHSRSKPDSILGLSLMTLIHIFFETSTIVFGLSDSSNIIYLFPYSWASSIYTLLFSLTFFLCINLVNIYYASAGWETIFPSHRSKFEYFIMGILGTLLFISLKLFPHHFIPDIAEFFEVLLTGSIVCLGEVLMIAFLMRSIIRHRLRPFEKVMNGISWGIGSIVVIISGITGKIYQISSISPLLNGLFACTVFLLVLVFCEELSWSIKDLKKRNSLF